MRFITGVAGSTVVVLGMCPLLSAAATYYVDATTGNDAKDGLSPSSAWQTLARINAQSFNPGDQILLKRGEEWREQLNITSSGSSDSPIIYSCYGDAGALPVINAGRQITGWTAAEIFSSTTIFSATVSIPVKFLLIDSGAVPARVAHYPDTGYLYIGGTVDVTPSPPTATPSAPSARKDCFLVKDVPSPDANLTPEKIVGAEIYLRTQRFIMENSFVTGFDSTSRTLSFSPGVTGTIKVNYGYRLSNKYWMMNEPGEWYYDEATGKIYLCQARSFPIAEHQIAAVERPYGIAIYINDTTPVHDIIVENLVIKLAERHGVQIRKAYNVTLRNLTILGCGTNGINVEDPNVTPSGGTSTHHVTLTANDISFCQDRGIRLRTCNYPLVDHNYVHHIGLFAPWRTSAMSSGFGRFAGIYYHNGNSEGILQYNRILTTGYSGILIGGHDGTTIQNHLVQNNIIDTACLLLDDGAGIYTGGGARRITIRANLVKNIIGDPEGIATYFTDPAIGQTPRSNAEGIYLDSGGHEIQVENNTVQNVTNRGLFLHNAYDCVLDGNIVYNAGIMEHWGAQLCFQDDANDSATVSGNTVNNNVFFPVGNERGVFLYSEFGDVTDFASFDNNVYSTLYTDSCLIAHYNPSYPTCIPPGSYCLRDIKYTLAQWRTAYAGQDLHSRDIGENYAVNASPAANDPADDALLVLNEQFVAQDISLQGKSYCSLDNTPVSGSVSLDACRSALLLSCYCNRDQVCNNREQTGQCMEDCGSVQPTATPTKTNTPAVSIFAH